MYKLIEKLEETSHGLVWCMNSVSEFVTALLKNQLQPFFYQGPLGLEVDLKQTVNCPTNSVMFQDSFIECLLALSSEPLFLSLI